MVHLYACTTRLKAAPAGAVHVPTSISLGMYQCQAECNVLSCLMIGIRNTRLWCDRDRSAPYNCDKFSCADSRIFAFTTTKSHVPDEMT